MPLIKLLIPIAPRWCLFGGLEGRCVCGVSALKLCGAILGGVLIVCLIGGQKRLAPDPDVPRDHPGQVHPLQCLRSVWASGCRAVGGTGLPDGYCQANTVPGFRQELRVVCAIVQPPEALNYTSGGGGPLVVRLGRPRGASPRERGLL